ncbi:hypothetical protein GN244_ATG16915 [Phytophthora infestans]|uniref:Uncharacterized protein n=2 Tax=Phytophthora infestans TaxID=4787 RepID=A0A833SZV1_PHYIN|nr:hypothetical protein GN244_ATG16915 [Phytophthora infestans]
MSFDNTLYYELAQNPAQHRTQWPDTISACGTWPLRRSSSWLWRERQQPRRRCSSSHSQIKSAWAESNTKVFNALQVDVTPKVYTPSPYYPTT